MPNNSLVCKGDGYWIVVSEQRQKQDWKKNNGEKEEEKTIRTVDLILHFGGKLISCQLAKRSVWAIYP